jgi:hypothetical protein
MEKVEEELQDKLEKELSKALEAATLTTACDRAQSWSDPGVSDGPSCWRLWLQMAHKCSKFRELEGTSSHLFT